MLADCWLLGGSVFFYCKIQTKKLTGFFFILAVDWLHGWRLPSLLSWSVVGWLVLAKRLTECLLTVDWWVARCFFTAKLRLNTWRVFFREWLGVFWCKIETKLLTELSWAVVWLHGWWFPSLVSWLVVGWLDMAKRLTECWLTVDCWVARCFLLQK